MSLKYWQVSGQLEGASQRHTAESGALAQQLGSQEENLTQTLRLLSRAQTELSTTRLALWQSREDRNRTQRQLEEERKQWRLAKSRLQEEKAKATRELAEAKSCQQMGCCPPGWALFRWKCLRVSSEWETWEGSRRDCGEQEAQLLILKPWDAGTFWRDAVMKCWALRAPRERGHTLTPGA
ncbi:PREDICTED: B-cell differentiation antigen CD72-like [Gekko japonicus]|uniref:B-cell differentiation antigen CD72-like n=1 Tax=Gekko japonicus TaxID=146911 RepID=A0ABM1JHT2_GEKJA|nr:PREDICTED: B-cell differentiation antigen CD72-like [Gekko japonicus]